eukprot:TRINITY_DN79117_c0_g1_i1.p1 TRINITY_DN79117_c0_g1~~TRINITY_DN79117_c0_g1_i1.p1  ORF type:complete len:369 (-),score=78.07 TRINITY_DN79117_c0_g1_i1:112-1218(-)
MSAAAADAARELLGVGPDAGPHEVQSAFRKLALVLHPDKSDSADAKAKFQLAVAARDYLLNPHEFELQASSASGNESKRRSPEEEQAFNNMLVADLLLRRAKVWGAWQRISDGKPCMALRPEKHICLCGHKLKDHRLQMTEDSQAWVFACSEHGCPCNSFCLLPAAASKLCCCGHDIGEHSFDRRFPKCNVAGCSCVALKPRFKCMCGADWSDHECKFDIPTAPPRSTPSATNASERAEPSSARAAASRARSLQCRAKINRIHTRLSKDDGYSNEQRSSLNEQRSSFDDSLDAELAAADAFMAKHSARRVNAYAAVRSRSERPPEAPGPAPAKPAKPASAPDGLPNLRIPPRAPETWLKLPRAPRTAR